MRVVFLSILLLATLPLSSCTEEKKPAGGHGEHSHGAGPHGGKVLDLPGKGHLEFCHDDAVGKVSVYLSGMDAKTPLSIATPPVLKIATAEGPKVLPMKAGKESGSWTVEDPALGAHHISGRLTFEVEGTPFDFDLEETHDH